MIDFGHRNRQSKILLSLFRTFQQKLENAIGFSLSVCLQVQKKGAEKMTLTVPETHPNVLRLGTFSTVFFFLKKIKFTVFRLKEILFLFI